jgi:hypothetical protein
LRRDFIDRYRDSGRGSVMADYEHVIRTTNLPETSPAVLWATEPPPVKPLRVPSETGRNTQAYGPVSVDAALRLPSLEFEL